MKTVDEKCGSVADKPNVYNVEVWETVLKRTEQTPEPPRRKALQTPQMSVCSANVIRTQLGEEHFDTCLIFGARRIRYLKKRKSEIEWVTFDTIGDVKSTRCV